MQQEGLKAITAKNKFKHQTEGLYTLEFEPGTNLDNIVEAFKKAQVPKVRYIGRIAYLFPAPRFPNDLPSGSDLQWGLNQLQTSST